MDFSSVVTVLSGHTSPETAYIVADYPYGFRLRCSIRYWIETKKGHGQRVVSQTTNPKRPGIVWNKPKAGTYAAVQALYLDTAGHVHPWGLTSYYDDAEIQAYRETFAAALTESNQKFLDAFVTARAMVRARHAEARAAETQEGL